MDAMKSAVFLERDGILNLVTLRGQQQIPPRSLEQLTLNEAALEPLLELKAAGFLLIATTNQPGVSQGIISRRELDLMHLRLQRYFQLDDILLCPHDAGDHCPCRKPRPGLLQEAAFKWQLDLDRCFVISDKWLDAQAAHVTGCTSLLIQSPWNGSGHHDFILPDLASAAAKIQQLVPMTCTV
jgi:D-glycero-D-manno-heptose 1,7-bisphosphate phosphatase